MKTRDIRATCQRERHPAAWASPAEYGRWLLEHLDILIVEATPAERKELRAMFRAIAKIPSKRMP